MKRTVRSFPWLPMLCLVSAYALLGWQLSFLSALWVIDTWLATVVVIFSLIWKGKFIRRWVIWGPTVLGSIFVLSLIITLSITYTQPFVVALLLLLTMLWSRLELQSRGIKRRAILLLLSMTAGSALSLGWMLGRYLALVDIFRDSPQWLRVFPG